MSEEPPAKMMKKFLFFLLSGFLLTLFILILPLKPSSAFSSRLPSFSGRQGFSSLKAARYPVENRTALRFKIQPPVHASTR